MEFTGIEALEAALADLGALLEQRDTPFTLYVIDGGAYMLLEPARAQATGELDIAARILTDGTHEAPAPLPLPLHEAALAVARVHGLSVGWLNAAAAASFDDLVLDGALDRAERRTWGGLTLLVAAREDLVELKLRAAHRRGTKGARYQRDLALMRPTDAELQRAATRMRTDRTEAVLNQVRRWRDGL